MRFDISLSKKYAITRNKAQDFIKEGLVSVNGKVIIKPSFELQGDETMLLQAAKKIHWVSRSAGKLEGFLEELRITNYEFRIAGMNCLDVGSSTGGFTQVLLEHGAAHIDAVDVGTNQLHSVLRDDARVTSFEKTDIRKFTSNSIYDIIVCDASFISLTEIFPSILTFAHKETKIILLWKPQFEVGKENLRKTGVPKDEKTVMNFQKKWEIFLTENNCKILQKAKSSVIGEAGNQEWLYFIKVEK